MHLTALYDIVVGSSVYRADSMELEGRESNCIQVTNYLQELEIAVILKCVAC